MFSAEAGYGRVITRRLTKLLKSLSVENFPMARPRQNGSFSDDTGQLRTIDRFRYCLVISSTSDGSDGSDGPLFF